MKKIFVMMICLATTLSAYAFELPTIEDFKSENDYCTSAFNRGVSAFNSGSSTSENGANAYEQARQTNSKPEQCRNLRISGNYFESAAGYYWACADEFGYASHSCTGQNQAIALRNKEACKSNAQTALNNKTLVRNYISQLCN